MKKSEIFKTIKLANAIADDMKTLAVDSEEYKEANQSLGWLLDTVIECKYCVLHHSNRTGHYWVTF